MKLTPKTRINAIINFIADDKNIIMSSDLNMTFDEYIKKCGKAHSNRLKNMLNFDYTHESTTKEDGWQFDHFVYQDEQKCHQFVKLTKI